MVLEKGVKQANPLLLNSDIFTSVIVKRTLQVFHGLIIVVKYQFP